MSFSLDDITRAVQRAPQRLTYDGADLAAVAAIITPDLDLILIRRAAHLGDPWSGQVSFPGGRMEPDDESPLDTAIRETKEELGVSLSKTMLLGELDVLPTLTPLPKLLVHPFVFATDQRPEGTPNGEVASVHSIGLDVLLRGDGRGTMTIPWRGQPLVLPRVDFDDIRLWGMTLRMVDDLLDRLDGCGVGLDRLGR
ncbi:MAG: CoA pyrophosphatase [Deltaproteobacteria bacterium]|nr:CoA pyrophosphatase [Deltaproteobacteria bacterium]